MSVYLQVYSQSCICVLSATWLALAHIQFRSASKSLPNKNRRIGARNVKFQRRFLSDSLLLILISCGAAYGQSTFGTILGTVRDPSGSIVPAAKVDLVNTGTNAVRSMQSDSNG